VEEVTIASSSSSSTGVGADSGVGGGGVGGGGRCGEREAKIDALSARCNALAAELVDVQQELQLLKASSPQH
jgi:hypothetical protein